MLSLGRHQVGENRATHILVTSLHKDQSTDGCSEPIITHSPSLSSASPQKNKNPWKSFYILWISNKQFFFLYNFSIFALQCNYCLMKWFFIAKIEFIDIDSLYQEIFMPRAIANELINVVRLNKSNTKKKNEILKQKLHNRNNFQILL